ncbi:galactose mutarotase-like enzyme [Angulomicrobium tetraedrale]|uniref:Galactose mutarotase-like enzyme n=1 Tax=Ancylobacter tetraedralis TaxID=217068 RepID=A0A839ZBF6_9HYPH|nr:aldose 1-epimerase family protein [Ancylobacter tetraedralis]MBB3772079.1 galactose mutarotase-like enzyme [Ancylobacter tetraedralis]
MSDLPVKLKSDFLSAEVAPLGAELVRLVDREGHDLLWNGDPAFWSGRAPLLFPIVGRLPGDQLVHKGVAYPMAQHGFARRRVFTLEASSPSSARFVLLPDEETRKQYPFEFALAVTYTLIDATLTIEAVVSNPGAEPLPASFGFHPAFRWPLPYEGARADHRLVFEKAEVEPVHRPEGGLLSAGTEPNPAVDALMTPTDEMFARDALIFLNARSRHVRFGVPRQPGLEVAFPGMPQLGLWSKPGAPFLCIEPWSGYASPPDGSAEFTDKPGLSLIAPGTSRSFGMSVRWLPDSGDEIGPAPGR